MLECPSNMDVNVGSVRNWDFFSLARGTVGLHNLM